MSTASVTARKGLIAVSAGLLVAGAIAATSASASAAPQRHDYPGSVPGFVTPRADTGSTDPDTTVEGELYLPLRDQSGAEALAKAVSTPGNPQYGKYINPRAWIAQYAPTPADLQNAEAYLKSQGATIWAVPDSRQYIVFRAPAQTVNAAFDTQLHNYRVHGKTVIAPATAASLPDPVADSVRGISVGSYRQAFTRPSSEQPGAGTTASQQGVAPTPSGKQPQPAAQTCSHYWGEHTGAMPQAYGRTEFPTWICGYTPGQLRSAGGVGSQQGARQTIAIIDAYASPTIKADTDASMEQAGEPALSNFQQIAPSSSDFVDTAACGEPSGWQTEETIDVQSAHSIAPAAKILYVGGFNCGGGLDIAMSTILDQGLSDIVSNSYGNLGEDVGDDVIRGEENLHLQAAGEGIGLYFSSGDNGDESTDLGYTSADYPASSPFVTAVGGTSEAINEDGSYGFETGWGDILDPVVHKNKYASPLPGNLYGGGAGGGVSSVFAEPDYQQGVVPDSLATSGTTSTPSRVVPDIADLADPYTGFQIGVSPITDDSTLKTGPLEYQTWGGTSLACPIAAAKMALVQAATGTRLGFANPALYQAASQKGAFHDVTAPPAMVAMAYQSARTGTLYLNTLDQGLSLFTGQGYDTMTGLGSIVEKQLADYVGHRG